MPGFVDIIPRGDYTDLRKLSWTFHLDFKLESTSNCIWWLTKYKLAPLFHLTNFLQEQLSKYIQFYSWRFKPRMQEKCLGESIWAYHSIHILNSISVAGGERSKEITIRRIASVGRKFVKGRNINWKIHFVPAHAIQDRAGFPEPMKPISHSIDVGILLS